MLFARRLNYPITLSRQILDDHGRRQIWKDSPRTRQKSKSGPTFLVIFVYMVVSVIGRFSVALLGFAYNLADIGFKTALYVPDWDWLPVISPMTSNKTWGNFLVIYFISQGHELIRNSH